jgi:acyl carrier protein
MKSVEARVEKIFKKVFESEAISGINKSSYPEWDSLKHIELILELEDEFLIELSNTASAEIYDLNSCVEILAEVL